MQTGPIKMIPRLYSGLFHARKLPVLSRIQTHSSAQSNEFERRVRPEFPSPVRYGFIPEEWFTFFYPKTGVTGPYMFGIGVGTYLLSKEIYVIEHEFYSGLSLAAVLIIGIKKFGPAVAKYLDKEIDDYEKHFDDVRNHELNGHQEIIEHEKKEQSKTEVQMMIMDVKKENIAMQLEAVYRERLALIHNEVKKRLDYQLQLQNVERKLAQKHMVQWIINNVKKAFTPDKEKATLAQCISDLQAMAKA